MMNSRQRDEQETRNTAEVMTHDLGGGQAFRRRFSSSSGFWMSGATPISLPYALPIVVVIRNGSSSLCKQCSTP